MAYGWLVSSTVEWNVATWGPGRKAGARFWPSAAEAMSNGSNSRSRAGTEPLNGGQPCAEPLAELIQFALLARGEGYGRRAGLQAAQSGGSASDHGLRKPPRPGGKLLKAVIQQIPAAAI